ncbi:Ig-like protein [Leptospira ryugenii]|uniref:Ig-like protein n=2 Tax=Leptospira ryugenii TaxID=1917863 RepID=A0A2P2E0L0_9LEPT|nr:Ig-like protein [Leptospira ryugenii]
MAVLVFITLQCKNGKSTNVGSEFSAVLSSGSNPVDSRQTPVDPISFAPNLPTAVGFGSSGPEVRFLFLTNSVDRYKPLEFEFSEAMDPVSVSNALTIKNITTDTVLSNFSLRWTSPVNLSIRFGEELNSDQLYEVEISSIARNANLNASLLVFRQSFRTEKAIQISRSLLVNTTQMFPIGTNKGIVLNKNTTTSLRLNIAVNHPEVTKEILLCKLGLLDSSNPLAVVCSSMVATGVKLCSGDCTASLSFDLLNSSILPPNIGSNLYFIRVETLAGSFSYFSVNFQYGELAADPNSKLPKIANLMIGQDSGIGAISELITRFAKGNFKLYDTLSSSDKSLNQFINKKSNHFPGGNCIPWPSAKLASAPSPNKIDYLSTIGPFCGIEVTGTIFESNAYPDVNYRAKADIYITSLTIDESSFPSGDTNLNFQFDIKNGIFDINILGKKLRGKFSIVLKVEEIEFFDYLLANTLVYYGQSIPGTDGDEVSFAYNEDPPVEVARRAFVRSLLQVNAQGKLNLTVQPYSFPSNFQSNIDCLSLPSTVSPSYVFACNPFASDWANHIQVNQVTGTGAVAAIVADVINQQIPSLKNKIVQNVLKDVTERVTPEILNNILGQLDSGILIGLPDYLPKPLNQVVLKLNANLEQDTAAKQDGTNFGLEGSLNASLVTCVKDSLNRCPWDVGYTRPSFPVSPYGTQSYIRTKSNLSFSSNLANTSANPGVLLKLHPDLINQALYHLWWNGGFNFEIDKPFIESINQFAGSSSLLNLTTSLLKADPIVTIFAPGQNNVKTANGAIYPNDDIVLSLQPVHPIYLEKGELSGNATLEQTKLKISFADLEITIRGKRSDSQRPNCPSLECKDGNLYTIAKVRISLKSNANLSFGKYALPNCVGTCTFSSSILASIGNPSLRIVTSKDIGELFYLIEPLEGQVNNPLALRPSGIKEIVNPLVKSLIVPLLNNITRDIPLPKLRACGMELYDLETLPIPGNESETYVLLHAKVQNILFTGSCRL